MTARVLIVDDETHARARIRDLLRSEGTVQVVGECESGDEVVRAVSTLQPDLLFFDVQIRGATAFDVIAEVGAENMPVIIFVTAFSEYAPAAFDVEAADYLLKPFDRERLRRALLRGLARVAEQRRRPDRAPREGAPDRPRHADWFMVRQPNRELRLVRVEDIESIEACGNYVVLHTGAERHLYRQTMAALEARLDPERFVRIHRSTIVSLESIASLEPIYAGDYEVRLRSGRCVRMSRNARAALERLTGRPG